MTNGAGEAADAGATPEWPPAAPVLAALLQLALPAALLLDIGAPFGRLFPWWPGASCGVADAASLPAAERDLLLLFRQHGQPVQPPTAPIFGLNPAADAALLAADRSTADRLVCGGAEPGQQARWTAPDTLLLRPAGSPRTPPESDPDTGRILLLIGHPARVESWELLLPGERTGPLFAAIRTAADVLAASGSGWRADGRLVSPRLATVALLRHGDASPSPLRMIPEALPHDLPPPPTGRPPPPSGGLTTGPVPRVRLLLGLLPPIPMRLRLRFQDGTPRAAFLDGVRRAAESDGEAHWTLPIDPSGDHATVLGLALPESGLTIAGLELLPGMDLA